MELGTCVLHEEGARQQSQRGSACGGLDSIPSEVVPLQDRGKHQFRDAFNSSDVSANTVRKVSAMGTESGSTNSVATAPIGVSFNGRGQTSAGGEKPPRDEGNGQQRPSCHDPSHGDVCGQEEMQSFLRIFHSAHPDPEGDDSVIFKDGELSEERCSISLWLLVLLNTLVVVIAITAICVVPLETARRMVLNNGLRSSTDFFSETASRAAGESLLVLQRVINSVFSSLQLDQTTQLYPWTDEDMPRVMQQLCGIVNSSLGSRLLYLHLSSPYTGFGAYCSRQYDGHTLIGKHVKGNLSDYRYVVDPGTLLYAEPRQPFTEVCNMTEEEYSVKMCGMSPYNVIAVNWNASRIERRWWVYSHLKETLVTYTYPFLDFKGNLAMITGAIQLAELQQFYSRKMVEDGVASAILVDLDAGYVLNSIPLARGPTKWDKWNCTNDEAEECNYSNLSAVEVLGSVRNPDMQVGVDKLGGLYEVKALLMKVPHVQLTFDHNGSTFSIALDSIDVVDGLQIASFCLINRSILLGTPSWTYKSVLITIGVLLFVIGFIEMVLFYFFWRPVHEISRGLSLMSQFRGGAETMKESSPVTEILLMQRRFFMLNHMLKHLKANILCERLGKFYLSCCGAALEQFIGEEAKESNGWSPDRPGEAGTAAGTTTAAATTAVRCADSFSGANGVGDFRFHADGYIGRDESSQFRRRYCTVLCVRLSLSEDEYQIGAMVQEFLGTCVRLVMRFGGVLEVLRPDFVMISFGSHSNMVRAQSQAACFSLELMKLSKSDIFPRLSVVVDAAEYLVGSCNIEGRNMRFTYGLRLPMQTEMLKNVEHLNCHILVTRPVASSLDGQFLTIPVDVVLLGFDRNPVVMYELRGRTEALEPESLADVQNTIRTIRHGFANMLGGRYDEALRLLTRVRGKDFQGDRLLRICRRLLRRGVTKPYHCIAGRMRAMEFLKNSSQVDYGGGVSSNLLTRPVLQTKLSLFPEGAELENTLFSGASARAVSLFRQAAPTDSRTETIADVDYEHGLFEMFLESPDDDDDDEAVDVSPVVSPRTSGSMAPSVRGNAKGELPFVFRDYQGNSWTRSVDRLGVGAFSVVYRGMSSSGDLVALKCFALRARNVELGGIVEELKLFSQLQHENIVQYIGCHFSSDYLIEVMELVPGGSLDSILSSFGSLSTMAVRRFLRDTLNGLMYLHSKNVVHCDVKPHNVLVAMDGVCKLSDFGSSLLRLTNSMRNISDVLEMRGTPGYMAPEVARGEVPTAKSDVFSLGVTMLELLTGRLPWNYVTTNGGPHTASGSSGHEGQQEKSENEKNDQEKDGKNFDAGVFLATFPAEAPTATAEDGAREKAPQEQASMPWETQDAVLMSISPTQMDPVESCCAQNANRNIEWLLRNPAQLVISVGKGEIKPLVPHWLEAEVCDFLESCVAFNPLERPTVAALLQHPWML